MRTDEGRWRLYVCPAAPAPSKHWWIDVLEADDPAGFADAEARTVFPGRREHRRQGSARPAHRRTAAGEAWICCHPLDVPDEEDRMTTAYATSARRPGVGLARHRARAAPGKWDSRGARLTTVLPDGRAAYDGRASKEENWFERIGLARLTGEQGRAGNDDAAYDARYLDVLPLPGRRLPHLLRSAAARREPRAAHGAHPAALTRPAASVTPATHPRNRAWHRRGAARTAVLAGEM